MGEEIREGTRRGLEGRGRERMDFVKMQSCMKSSFKKYLAIKKTFLHLKNSVLKQKILAFDEYYSSWPI